MCMNSSRSARLVRVALILLTALMLAAPLMAQAEHRGGGEANLVLPDLNQATFLGYFWPLIRVLRRC